MDVDLLMVSKFSQQPLSVFERLLKRVGVGPGEIRRVRLRVEISKGVTEFDREVTLAWPPAKRARAALPLHRVGADPVDGTPAHFIQLALACHTFNLKSQGLSTLDALDAEVEPGVVVTAGCIW